MRTSSARSTPEYLERLARVQDRLVRDRGAETWWTRTERPDDFLVAYFSAEFGLDESLPVYSGGLGVLAGDHLKAASELGVPLVGDRPLLPARLLPPAARRRGRQVEHYPRNDTSGCRSSSCPMAPVVSSRTRAESSSRCASASGARRSVACRCTSSTRRSRGIRIGRASPTPSTAATGRTGSGRSCARRRRRARLARARPRAVRVPHERGALRVSPARALRELRRDRHRAEEALEQLRASTVFTTHTPVPAGNEAVRSRARAPEPRGARRELRARLGRVRRARQGLARREAFRPDAVRAADVALRERRVGAARRGLAGDVAPALAGPGLDEVPITSVTNGVHQRTWISRRARELLGDTDPQFERARENPRRRPAGRPTEREAPAARATSRETRGARELDPDVLTSGSRGGSRRTSARASSSRGRSGSRAARRHRAADPGAPRRKGASGGRGGKE